MIRYSLSCDKGHDFEAWFKSGEDFDQQANAGYLSCPQCGSATIRKSVMAPAIGRSEERVPAVMPGAQTEVAAEMLSKMRDVVRTIRTNSEDVGERFPEEARKIHYGEAETRGITGQASGEDVRALIDEGIEIIPLPVLPEDTN